jgi:hypothetical protein
MEKSILDKISCVIILRALFLFDLLNKGWSIRKCKNSNDIHLFKSVKKEI